MAQALLTHSPPGGNNGSLSLCIYTPSSSSSSSTQYQATCSANITPLETLTNSNNTAMGGSGTAIAVIPGTNQSNTYFAIGDTDGGIFLCQVTQYPNPLSCTSSFEALDHAVSNLIFDSVTKTLWVTTDKGVLLSCPYTPQGFNSPPSLGGCTTQVNQSANTYFNSTLSAQVQQQPQSQPLDIYFASGSAPPSSDQEGAAAEGGGVATPGYSTGVYQCSSSKCIQVISPGSDYPYQVLAGYFLPATSGWTESIIVSAYVDNATTLTYFACPTSNFSNSNKLPLSIEDSCPYSLNNIPNIANAVFYATTSNGQVSDGYIVTPDGSSVQTIQATAEGGSSGSTALQSLSGAVNSVLVDQNGNVLAQYGGNGLIGANPFDDNDYNQSYSLIADSGSTNTNKLGAFLEQLAFCLLGAGLSAI